MAESLVGIEITQPGERADELLAGLAERLHLEQLVPDGDHLFVPVNLDYPEAKDLVTASLEDLGSDWRDHLFIESPASAETHLSRSVLPDHE